MDFSPSIGIVSYQTVASTTQPSSQCNLSNTVSQTSYLGGFLLFLMMGCICFGWWYRKQSKQKVLDEHHQQIERLERIWKMGTHPEL